MAVMSIGPELWILSPKRHEKYRHFAYEDYLSESKTLLR